MSAQAGVRSPSLQTLPFFLEQGAECHWEDRVECQLFPGRSIGLSQQLPQVWIPALLLAREALLARQLCLEPQFPFLQKGDTSPKHTRVAGGALRARRLQDQ